MVALTGIELSARRTPSVISARFRASRYRVVPPRPASLADIGLTEASRLDGAAEVDAAADVAVALDCASDGSLAGLFDGEVAVDRTGEE